MDAEVCSVAAIVSALWLAVKYQDQSGRTSTWAKVLLWIIVGASVGGIWWCRSR